MTTETSEPLLPPALRRFKPFSAYKDSGVEWVGQIPAHWDVQRTKHVARLRSGHTPSRQHPEYWVDCTIPWFGLADVWQLRDGRQEYVANTNEKISALGLANSAARLLPKGTVILSRTASVGFSGIMATEMATTQDFVNWVCGKSIRSEYLLYVFRSMTHEFRRLTMGSTHQTIYMPDVGTFSTPVPPIFEQDRIVAFIRKETVRIDELVAKKERLMELLQEKRAALITRAVTKGLDPTVPIEDSGVEWLGQIPAHWEVKRLRDIAASLQTGPFGSQLHAAEYVSGGCPIINPVNLRDGCLIPDWNCTVDEDTAGRLERHTLLAGDIIFARRGELGRCGLVMSHQEGWICGTGSLRLRPRRDLSTPEFLLHALSTRGVGEWLELQSVGATMLNLNGSIIGRIPIALPPMNEQEEIVFRVSNEIRRSDTLVAKVREAIGRVKELRTALTSAAVTGKIDVRAA